MYKSKTNDIKIASPIVTCTLTLENLNINGSLKSSSTYKNCKLILGRNEFKRILLQVESPKKSFCYRLKQLTVHKSFVKDGKATLNLKEQLINIMIANAPPSSLMTFIRVLLSKLEKLKQENQENTPIKQLLLSSVQNSFEEISPITFKEIETLRQQRNNSKQPLQSRNPNIGLPDSSPVSSKRKFDGYKKEFPNVKAKKYLKISDPIILNIEQKKVLTAVQSGRNVFFTGSAGTGKSFLLRRIIGSLPPDTTYVTASTGAAACHIGGTTLHSFAGIGSGRSPLEECISLAKRKTFIRQWRTCRCLVIDEISMVDAEYFTKLEGVARALRNPLQSFGGIQVVVCGDFLQLPPVVPTTAVSNDGRRRFCFQSAAWHRAFSISIQLRQVRRQNDAAFVQLLQNIRLGRCSAADEATLRATATQESIGGRDGIAATRLCSHTEDAKHINEVHLTKLEGKLREWSSVDIGGTELSLDASTPAVRLLRLKVGAQVMLNKNIDVGMSLVNGARGVVTRLQGEQGFPVVKFVCGITREMTTERWTAKHGGSDVATRTQVPLKLAWAFSIHKAQGLTLDCVEMSLSRVFECGQAYVALSRARSLQSLRVLHFLPSCVKANADAIAFYQQLDEEENNNN